MNKTTIHEYLDEIKQEAVTLLEAAMEAKKQKEKESDKPVIKIKHPNAFREWCDKQGLLGENGHVTCECICKALQTDDPILHRRANFAYNFGFKRQGKTCACVEELRKKKGMEDLTYGNENILTDIVDGIKNTLVSGLYSLSDMLNTTTITIDNVIKYKTKTPSTKELYKWKASIIKALKNNELDINSILNIKVPVILGFNTTVYDAVKKLKEVTVYKNTIDVNIDKFVNRVLDLPGNKLSDLANIKLDLDRSLSKLKSVLSSMLSEDKLVDVKPLNEVLPNISKIPYVIDELLKLGRDYRVEDLEEFNNRISEISEILKDLADSTSEQDLSKNEINAIADKIRLVAEAVTELSVTYYLYYSISDMVIKISDIIVNSKTVDRSWYQEVVNNISNFFSGLIK